MSDFIQYYRGFAIKLDQCRYKIVASTFPSFTTPEAAKEWIDKWHELQKRIVP